MNFAAEEYDGGSSLHVNQPASQPMSAHAFKDEEAQPHFKFEI
jgi:hypothetical protein